MAEQSMVERVCDAIFIDVHIRTDAQMQAARRAIEAMREPTETMLVPCTNVLSHFDGEHGDHNVYFKEPQAEKLWQTMIDAALKA